jgi:hypothetical protein
MCVLKNESPKCTLPFRAIWMHTHSLFCSCTQIPALCQRPNPTANKVFLSAEEMTKDLAALLILHTWAGCEQKYIEHSIFLCHRLHYSGLMVDGAGVEGNTWGLVCATTLRGSKCLAPNPPPNAGWQIKRRSSHQMLSNFIVSRIQILKPPLGRLLSKLHYNLRSFQITRREVGVSNFAIQSRLNRETFLPHFAPHLRLKHSPASPNQISLLYVLETVSRKFKHATSGRLSSRLQ